MADNKFTFAHLIGLGKKAKASKEEDDKARKAKGRKAEEGDREEDAEDNESEAEDQDDEKENGKKGKKAEGDDDDPDAEEEDAEGDEEDAEDDDDNKDVKKGRRAEQKRCARIFGSKAAAGRPDMAAHLAFNTRMSSSEAISTLKAMGAVQPTTQRASLDSRMREEQQVRVGPDAQAPVSGSANALVQKMTTLYNTNKGAK